MGLGVWNKKSRNREIKYHNSIDGKFMTKSAALFPVHLSC